MSKMPKKAKDRIEAPVKDKVKELLDAHGWFWWMPAGTMYGTEGIADFNALRQGVFMAVETKWHDRLLTPNQRAYLNSIRAEKGFAFVVREGTGKYDVKGLANLQAFLEALDRSVGAVAALPATTAPADREKAVAPEDGAMMINAIRELTQEL